jgi:thiol-disulfide isomerase/thioredoxin
MYRLGLAFLFVSLVLSLSVLGCGGHELEGSMARAFKLRSMARIEVDTAEHVGKHIVVLHFWSTLSEDSREGLQALQSIARDYWNHPVKVYAVNVGQSRETLRRYLKGSEDLTLPILLDERKYAAELYGAEDLPLTVIVERNGFIQYVGGGIGRRYEAGLRESLNTLLSGKLLVDFSG